MGDVEFITMVDGPVTGDGIKEPMVLPSVRRVPIKGWPGYYAGSDGEVYSLHSGDFEPLAKWEGGRERCRYWKVTLYRSTGRGRGVGRAAKANFYVHNLIGRAFLGRKPPRAEVGHRDGNRFDNRSSNLAWRTKKQNEADKVAHGTAPRGEKNGRARLSAIAAVAIRSLRAPTAEVAKFYNISERQVQRIRAGTAWRDPATNRTG